MGCAVTHYYYFRPNPLHIVTIFFTGCIESKAAMERKSLNQMKDSGIGGRSLTESWDYNNRYYGGDLLGGFSWPPRSYTCSFCKREFRSAQALGGHMNVHRRDRARLRESPAWDTLTSNFNPNPNPNPNFSSFTPSTRFPPFSTYTFPSLLTPSLASFSSSPSSASSSEMNIPSITGTPLPPLSSKGGETKAVKTLFGVGDVKGFVQEDECKILKKGDMVTLDFGLCGDRVEDLDLELRLGYS